MAAKEDNRKVALPIACGGCTHKCLATHSSLPLHLDAASFFKVMAGNFSSLLEIPAEFAIRTNLRTCKDAVLKGPSGNLWHVNFCCTNTSASFRNGWRNFVSDNGIASKDILVFRHAIDTYFVVQIFGAMQCEKHSTSLENHTSCCLKEGFVSGICNEKSCEHRKIPKKISANIFVVEPRRNGHKKFKTLKEGKEKSVLDCSVATLEKNKKMLRKSENDISKNQILSKNHPRFLSAVPRAASCSVTNNYSEDFAAHNSVELMKPKFLVTMCKTAVSGNRCRLVIPKDFAQCWLPKENGEIILVHHKNPGTWRVMLKIYQYHGFFGGWKSFVDSNKLQKGDRCVFELVNRVHNIFRVQVIK